MGGGGARGERDKDGAVRARVALPQYHHVVSMHAAATSLGSLGALKLKQSHPGKHVRGSLCGTLLFSQQLLAIGGTVVTVIGTVALSLFKSSEKEEEQKIDEIVEQPKRKGGKKTKKDKKKERKKVTERACYTTSCSDEP